MTVRSLRGSLIVAGLLFTSVSERASGQGSPAGSLADQVVHVTWTRGLPGNLVRRVAQTPEGYLLLATDAGLARFDGLRFTVHTAYGAAYPDSLPDQYLNDVLVARDGSTWIATMHAGVVHYANGRFRTYGVTQGLPDADVNALYQDGRGRIWAGTRSGLARLSGDRFTLVRGSGPHNVNALAEDAGGELWVGTDLGLFHLRDGRLVHSDVPWLAVARMLRLLRARDGSMWLATGQGLAQMERGAGDRYRVVRRYGARDGLRSVFVSSIVEQRGGVIWVGTLGGGVARLEPNGRFRSLGTAEGLADNNVSDVFIDREENVWAGMVDGLTRVRVPTLQNWRGAGIWTTSIVWSARADRDGSVWVGTGGDGAVRIAADGSTQSYSTPDGLPSEVVLTSYRSRRGTLWLGTKRGLARLAGDQFVDETARLGIAPIGVRSIMEDDAGRFYVGTDTALMVRGPRGLTMVPRRKGVLSGRIYSVAQDRRGTVWVVGAQLARLENDSLRVFIAANGDSVSQAMDVLPDTMGVWSGQFYEGLSLIRGDTLFRFSPTKTGIVSQVLNIIDDGRGHLWLMSGQGLQRVRKADLLAFVDDSTRDVPSRLFTREDGLRSHDFAKGGNSSGSRDASGRLWLPTTAGLVLLNPRDIRTDSTVPQVFVERVLADGVSMPLGGDVRLPRGTTRVRIEFTATLLASPSRVRLMYRLEGVDRDWRSVDDSLQRVADYERVPRGRYRFVVRAVSADGVPSTVPAEVTVVSTPSYTSSPWFWALLAVLAMFIGTVAYRWRVGILHRQAARLQTLVHERTEALAARERLEQQLLHAQKLESVGRLAGGVAHDLNNLLTAILGHAELALSEPDVPEHLRADLDEVRTVSMRAANLTRQLLAFARKQVVQPRVLRLGDLVAHTDVLVRRLLSENIVLHVEALEGDWAVRADPSQLEQVLLNLALNARDAMPQGGRLTIRTRAVALDAAFVDAHPGFAVGDHVVLEVADTGVGMSPEVQSHLFEPFFTTKEPGKGTGLGLATAFGIVSQNGGHIVVDTAEGEGSTFRVYFPRVEGSVAPSVIAAPLVAPHGSERVLLVEDEQAVRDTVERTLRTLGYSVVTARDGLEALQVLEAEQARIDLVLTDVRMPQMGGIALAEEVRRRWPTLRLVFMSGHSEALVSGAPMLAGTMLLRKPFVAAELAVALRGALEAPTG
ncbi:MAG: two-component regulator propeller domain-containing protein [Gemmatimonadota bacterium]|nr:two-component regulator propeller domain-containing protein [Gemmatimonadota bacterium]